mmetsp:Transcript_14198/g.33167  ORF Transcript_14198/g.33167 Transcript_14198/m.33167 type:complete len:83 (-) Transcript_14198:136-384(-)
MSRHDTIVSAPFTSRSTTKSPALTIVDNIVVFLLTPNSSQALTPLLMSQTLLLSQHLVDSLLPSLLQPHWSPAYRFVVLFSL